MIFIAKNEDNIPTWKLAKNGKKVVTRRLKPMPIGKEFAIQPGRGKFAVCRGKVISCISSYTHFLITAKGDEDIEWMKEEAKLEGFRNGHRVFDIN